jgi:hypothetical protein
LSCDQAAGALSAMAAARPTPNRIFVVMSHLVWNRLAPHFGADNQGMTLGGH